LFNEMVANITAITDYPKVGLNPTISDTRILTAICQAIVDQVGITPTGIGTPFFGTSAPTGWIFASGNTIGDGSSGGTERANADTSSLFTQLWNAYPNTILPIQDSTGAGSTRGVSAAADFAAHKRLPVPDLRGRAAIGKDDMGGTAAGRMTLANGLDGTVLGNVGGEQVHTLSVAEIPSHTHNIQNNNTAAGAGNILRVDSAAAVTGGTLTDPIGGGGAHNNVQPILVTNYIIKL
jgi:microcystin-dependent protein